MTSFNYYFFDYYLTYVIEGQSASLDPKIFTNISNFHVNHPVSTGWVGGEVILTHLLIS